MVRQPGATLLDLGGRIPELDGIRGVAVGLVVICHYFIGEMTAPVHSLGYYALRAGRLTWSGVDLFFVLSGFLIGGILLDARQSSNYFQVFYARRFLRIVPIYAVLLAAGFFFSVFRLARFNPLMRDALPWLPYAFFLQNVWMAYRSTFGAMFFGATWSLAVEEQFYLTLPWVIRIFQKRRRLVGLLVAGVAAAPLLRLLIHVRWPSRYIAWYALMPCRADALLLGVLAAILIRDERYRFWLENSRIVLRLSLFSLALGIVAITRYEPDFSSGYEGAFIATVGYTWLALFYVCILLYAVTQRDGLLSQCLRWGWLRWLGSIAYGTYLFHVPVLYLLYGLIWSRAPQIHTMTNFWVSVLAIAVTIGACRASWVFFEKPLINLGHRRRYEFTNSAAPAFRPV